MQNYESNLDKPTSHEDDQIVKQFSNDVIEYSNQVEGIIAWLFEKESELQKRVRISELENAPFNQVLDEYSNNEKLISEFCEYSQTIMNCKEEGHEMRENVSRYSDEDRDEIGIQMDTMEVCYEKFKILATDRIRELRNILEDRQQLKIERFEEWLTRMESKMAMSSNIGPDLDAIRRQKQDLLDLGVELEQKQDFLNFMSNVIIFDDVDTESLQIRSRSCVSLDHSLEKMNRRWIEICRYVEDRDTRLKRAENIWILLGSEGSQLMTWFNQVEKKVSELSQASKNQADTDVEESFVQKLMARSNKLEAEIKSKQSFYTGLENRVRLEIESFDDPCSMLVIELEKKLEDLQDSWNGILNRKRILDYTLQALADKSIENQIERKLPENQASQELNSPINNQQIINSFIPPDGSQYQDQPEKDNFVSTLSRISSFDEDASDGKEVASPNDVSLSDELHPLNNHISSDTRSTNNETNSHRTFYDDSQDEISSTSMTASFPTNPNLLNSSDASKDINQIASQEDKSDDNASASLWPHHHDLPINHNCRVEEWKHSLESFTTWLKQVETSLGVESELDVIVGPTPLSSNKGWAKIDPQQRLLLLIDIERQIVSSWQDEFDCLILQGQQIIEDLMPEIGENEYEAHLKQILADAELRYSVIKRYLNQRKRDLMATDQWLRLLKASKELCDYLINQMSSVRPESSIGVDLTTLTQQREELIRIKTDLEENTRLQSNIHDSEMFLKLCETIHYQLTITSQKSASLDRLMPEQQHFQKQQRCNQILLSLLNDIWESLEPLREDVQSQLDRLTIHHSELSQLIEDRLARLDLVNKKMYSLQHKMQEFATELQVAEILKSKWEQLDNLTIERLSEQLEDLKLYREQIEESESTYKMMSSILNWLSENEVPLSNQDHNRIKEMNSIWDMIQIAVEERQKLIEQAFDNQSASEQKFLESTVSDLPSWERRVATSKVPYFVNHTDGKTCWDHPKFDDLLKTMDCTNQIVFAAYKAALKVRMVQKRLGIDQLMLEDLRELIDLGLQASDDAQDAAESTQSREVKVKAIKWAEGLPTMSNNQLLDVERVIQILKLIYQKIKEGEKSSMDTSLSIDLTLNWLLNLYDPTRTGYISTLSLKVGLCLLCCATREEKYIYMFHLMADRRSNKVDPKSLGTLFDVCMRVLTYLGEEESFGGQEIIAPSVSECFKRHKYDLSEPISIELNDYLSWLRSEPQFIVWLPVLHRLLISENVSHQVKCRLCGAQPMIGLRYRCLRCLKFNVCQSCFLAGRHVFEHHDPMKHPMREYCSNTSSSDTVRDLTKILRNKLSPKKI